jgi:hypothetical protein
MVASALPVSAQVARPQSALAVGDNSDLLSLVRDDGSYSGRSVGNRAGKNIGNSRGSRNDGARASRNRGNWNNNNRSRWSNNWRGRRHYGNNNGVGFGFAAGALLGSAIASQPRYYQPYAYAEGDAVAYCMSRYQSYDPASGTYLGFDGYRHPCP